MRIPIRFRDLGHWPDLPGVRVIQCSSSNTTETSSHFSPHLSVTATISIIIISADDDFKNTFRNTATSYSKIA